MLLSLQFKDCAMIAVTLNTVDAHGSVHPLHSGIENHRLSTIIFGSGMFNNNIALIFVMVLERLVESIDSADGNLYITDLMKVGFLSGFFGVVTAALLTYLTRRVGFLSSNALSEVFFVISGAYATYMLAHFPFFSLSGDVALFFYGLFVGHYDKFNMSVDAIRQVGFVLNIIYISSEAFTYIYVGLSFESALDQDYNNVKLAFAMLLILLGSRSLALLIIRLTNYKK